jgi:hypothetical protein
MDAQPPPAARIYSKSPALEFEARRVARAILHRRTQRAWEDSAG